jgi:hypothetical protein
MAPGVLENIVNGYEEWVRCAQELGHGANPAQGWRDEASAVCEREADIQQTSVGVAAGFVSEREDVRLGHSIHPTSMAVDQGWTGSLRRLTAVL